MLNLPHKNVADQEVRRNFEAVAVLMRPQVLRLMFAGEGSPEGVVAAQIGSTYHRTDGGAGTSYYVKESGAATDDTGWVGK